MNDQENRTNNVYAGQPDDRQSMDPATKPSRFRPVYRPLNDEEKALHDEIKAKAVELEGLFEKVGTGRYQSLALTELELAVMWAVKQLTS